MRLKTFFQNVESTMSRRQANGLLERLMVDTYVRAWCQYELQDLTGASYTEILLNDRSR